MKFRRNQILTTVIACVAIGAGLYLYLVRWDSARLGPYYSPTAVSNKFLAAEKYLQRYNVNIEKIHTIDKVFDRIDEADVLLMTKQIGFFTNEQVKKIFDWIRRGGTLIYQTTRITPKGAEIQDVVMQELGIRFTVGARQASVGLPPLDMHHSSVPCSEIRGRSEVRLENALGSEPVTYDVNYSTNFQFQSLNDAESWQKTVHQDLSQGRGNVVLIPGMRPWQNNVIHCYDNARFLRDMVLIGDRRRAHLLWVEGFETDPLYLKLWDWFPNTILALAILLLFWLWNRIPRDHFAKPSATPSVINTEDYLASRSAYRWKKANTMKSLDAMRDEVLGKQWRELDTAELDKLASAIGSSRSELLHALSDGSPRNQASYIEAVANLNRLRGVK